MMGFGAVIGSSDMSAATHIGQLCDAYGMDTISAGATVAFAMECREHGLLPAGAGEPELAWGDMKGVLELLPKIALRQGLGDLLAEGTVRAADRRHRWHRANQSAGRDRSSAARRR